MFEYNSTALITTLLLLTAALAVASAPALSLGDYLFARQSYDEAITEYKRFLFFHPDSPQASDVLHKISMAYRAEKRWAEAVEAMTASIGQTEDAELKSERGAELAVTLIASGNHNLALIQLIRLETKVLPDPLLRRVHFLRGAAHIYLFNFEQAREAFRTYFNITPGTDSEEEVVDALFEEALRRPQKSEKVAKALSTILPGAGQAYAGDWRDSLNALILNGLLGYLMVDAAIDERYDDAVRTLFFLSYRYYLGNRYHAGEDAKQFNERENRKHAAKILNALTSQVRDVD